MNYVPIPVALLGVGRLIPVDLWSDTGQLLLRRGQPLLSEEHREKLHAFNACATEGDTFAWQRAYERMVYEMLRDGMDLQSIATAPMPSEIRESDYVVGAQLSGGWLDLQEVLRGILYQGGLATNPLQRLAGLASKVQSLLEADADDSLLCLFLALADDKLGYSATHALLCAVIGTLTAEKLGLTAGQRHTLLQGALTMNIGMARDQDFLARQVPPPSDWQRNLIRQHPEISVDILARYGVDDPDHLDVVRWHHLPTAPEALQHNYRVRLVLNTADAFVAKLAARKSRAPLSALGAAKSMYVGAQGDAVAVGSAMATAVGFYPPGSFVRLVNGDTAVAVQRGARANTPWVICILDKKGLPTSRYQCRDTQEPDWAIAAPVNYQTVKVAVSLEKVRRARDSIAAA